MTLEILHSRNPRLLIQDLFPSHWPHVASKNAELLHRADTAPIKVRCACGKVLKVPLERDYFNTDGRREHRRLVRMARSPEGQGVMGFIKSLYEIMKQAEPSAEPEVEKL